MLLGAAQQRAGPCARNGAMAAGAPALAPAPAASSAACGRENTKQQPAVWSSLPKRAALLRANSLTRRAEDVRQGEITRSLCT
jgi:hypothetical protein